MSYQTIIVGIAGGTGSGKTSVTQAIIKNLEKQVFTQFCLNRIHITREMIT